VKAVEEVISSDCNLLCLEVKQINSVTNLNSRFHKLLLYEIITIYFFSFP
jgi:hypothetical protein